MAFIQLVTNYINNVDNPDSRAEDLKTLRSFVRVIQIVTDLSETKSYTTRLSVFTQTMTNFAAAYESPLLCKPLAILPEQLHTGPCKYSNLRWKQIHNFLTFLFSYQRRRLFGNANGKHHSRLCKELIPETRDNHQFPSKFQFALSFQYAGCL